MEEAGSALIKEPTFMQDIKSIKTEVDESTKPAEYVEIEILFMKTENTEQENLELVKCDPDLSVKKEIVDGNYPVSSGNCPDSQPQDNHFLKPYTVDNTLTNHTVSTRVARAGLITNVTRTRTVECHSCEVCGKVFNHKLNLYQHRTVVHGGGQFQCGTCSHIFKSKHSLYQHVKIFHIQKTAEPKPLPCEYCQKTYQTEYGLKAHMLRSHTTGSYRCNECTKEFRCKQYLSVHYSRVHSREKHECDVCKKMFKSKSLLAEHLKFVHGARQYKCNICNKELKKKSSLRDHEKRGTCLPTTFDNVSASAQVQNEVTIKKEPGGEQLEVGPVVFQHTDLNYRPYNQEQKGDTCLSNPAAYRCNTCNKDFKSKQYLSLHNTRVHSGEKFECEVCKKVYRSKYVLTEHLKYVHRTSWYRCNLCKKELKRKSSLRKHLKRGICLPTTADSVTDAVGVSERESKEIIFIKEPCNDRMVVVPVVFQPVDQNKTTNKNEPQDDICLPTTADNVRVAFDTSTQNEDKAIIKQEPDEDQLVVVPVVFQNDTSTKNEGKVIIKREPDEDQVVIVPVVFQNMNHNDRLFKEEPKDD